MNPIYRYEIVFHFLDGHLCEITHKIETDTKLTASQLDAQIELGLGRFTQEQGAEVFSVTLWKCDPYLLFERDYQ